MNTPTSTMPAAAGSSMNNFSFELTQEEKDALKSKRNLAIRKLGSLGLLMTGCSLVAIAIGIASIAVDAPDPSPPYIVGLALISGVMMMFAGVMAIFGAMRGRSESDKYSSDISTGLKCYVVAFFAICTAGISICLVSAGAGGILGIIMCVLDFKVKGKKVDTCEPNVKGSLALSVLTMIVCLALCILSIFGTCFFCLYGRAFGFKSKRERALEMRLRHMQAQAAHQQKQQQYNTSFFPGQ